MGFAIRGITPAERNQAITIAAAAVPVARIARAPKSALRAWKFGASTIATYAELGAALPALGPSRKFGIRYGGAGVSTIGSTFVGGMYMGGTPEADLPIPIFAFGLTAVPNTSSRLVYEQNKSRPGENTSSSQVVSGPLQTRKTMRGASAQRGRSRPSSKKSGISGARLRVRGGTRLRESPRSRKPKAVPYRKGGCPPGYRYDRRKKMCVSTSK